MPPMGHGISVSGRATCRSSSLKRELAFSNPASGGISPRSTAKTAFMSPASPAPPSKCHTKSRKFVEVADDSSSAYQRVRKRT